MAAPQVQLRTWTNNRIHVRSVRGVAIGPIRLPTSPPGLEFGFRHNPRRGLGPLPRIRSQIYRQTTKPAIRTPKTAVCSTSGRGNRQTDTSITRFYVPWFQEVWTFLGMLPQSGGRASKLPGNPTSSGRGDALLNAAGRWIGGPAWACLWTGQARATHRAD